MNFGSANSESGAPAIAAMQHNGPQYRANDVRWQLTDTFGEISMELADAYPEQRVSSYVRTVRLDKQHNGPQYRANDVRWQLTDTFGEISMELADAYPEQRVSSYVRTVRLDKEEGITVTDVVSCGSLQPVLSLITCEEPFWNEETLELLIPFSETYAVLEEGITVTDVVSCGSLQPVLSLITCEEPFWNEETLELLIPFSETYAVLLDSQTEASSSVCKIQGAAKVIKERLPITDNRLKTAWKQDMWRTLIYLQSNQCSLSIQ